jgi:hypothetical protein
MNVKEFLQTPNWAIRLSKLSYSSRKMIENNIVFQTPFLPQTATIPQRAWHIVHEVNTVPVCSICGEFLKFQKTNKYSSYCSVKCSRKSPDVHKKKLKTEIANCGSVEKFREKKAAMFRHISQELYGVDNISQAESIKKQIKKKRG